MREVFRRAVKASHFSDLPVLILGETGTGKQRLAEAVHALDLCRRDKPFVTVNCGALSKTLAESELFGHAKGAFSGASGERKGLFRAANGGTLMLDEIGELDLELQPKLLRVLQERRLLPVGEDYEHPIDVRVIAATNRPLETMIAEEQVPRGSLPAAQRLPHSPPRPSRAARRYRVAGPTISLSSYQADREVRGDRLRAARAGSAPVTAVGRQHPAAGELYPRNDWRTASPADLMCV